MKSSELEIRQRLAGSFIEFPAVRTILSEIQRAVDEYAVLTEPNYLAILAETGVGKTRMLKHFAAANPRVHHEQFTEVPVLYVEVPSKCNPGTLAGEMLRAMGSPFWAKGTEKERTHQLSELLMKCKVRVVLLDEVNHLADRGAEKTHYEVADWIKQLTGCSRASFAIAGIPTLDKLLQVNEQVRDRFLHRLWLTPFSLEDAEASSLTLHAYRAFQSLLGDLPCVDFSAPDVARMLVFATGGRLRPLRYLLDRAVREAYKKSIPSIGLQELSRAFSSEIFPGATLDRNPFDKDFSGYPLIRAGEPFAPPGLTGIRPTAPTNKGKRRVAHT